MDLKTENLPMSRSLLLTYAAGAVLVAGGLTLSVAASVQAASPAPSPPVRRVVTAPLAEGDVASALRFSGTVQATRRARLAFTVAGRLSARPALLGDRVAAHTVLARLDAGEYAHASSLAEAALGEARARAAQDTRELDRTERLAAARAATDQEVEQARAAAEISAAGAARAAAAAAEARRRVAESTLAAPWAGIVREVLAEPGEYLLPGQPVVELAGDGDLEVEVGVPESLLGDLTVDQPVTVILPFARSEVVGRVRSVGRAALGAGRLFPVVVALPEHPAIVAGTTAEVLIERSARGLVAPLAAVVNPGGAQPKLFVVRAGRAVAVAVEVLALLGDGVAVRGELAAEDRVVVAGGGALLDGDAVAERGAEDASR
jgi:RND family efflux transporter MFP subunit